MFAAVLTFDDHSSPEDWASPERWLATLTPLYPAQRTGIHRGERLLTVQVRHPAQGDPDDPLPFVSLHSGKVVLFWGRLDNRNALRTQLEMEGGSDAQLTAAGFERWGVGLAEHLVGDYALAIVDSREGSAYLARDPLGVRPLYYLDVGKALIVATHPSAFLTLLCDRPDPDPDWMARYLTGTSMSHVATALTGVRKLPGGHFLNIAKGRALEPVRYFTFRDDPAHALHHDESWVEAYRELLKEAVACRLDRDHPMGSEHSGGLDSSTITAYLAHLLGEPGDRLHAFGFVSSDEEPACILETSLHAKVTHNHLITHRTRAASIEEGVDRMLLALGYPEEHGNGAGHTPFYQLCRLHGIATLFSGFGGDEVVTNSGHHLRHELLDGGHYGALFSILPGNVVTRTLRWGKAVATRLPNPTHFAPLLMVQKQAQGRWFVRDEVAQRLGLVAAQTEQARFAAPYRRINGFALGRLGEAFVPTRLENCTLSAAAHGIDYRWPLLDVRLIQQYLDTPAIEKSDHRMGRLLHRRAAAPVLGPTVAWKPEKAMGALVGDREIDLAPLLRAARAVEANLHPALEPLIDRQKLSAVLAQAEAMLAGPTGVEAQLRLYTTLKPLVTLDRWLHGGFVEGKRWG